VFKARQVPKGYTEEELDEDNPYNQWMYDKWTNELKNWLAKLGC
jgi:hypothetical protein